MINNIKIGRIALMKKADYLGLASIVFSFLAVAVGTTLGILFLNELIFFGFMIGFGSLSIICLASAFIIHHIANRR